MPFRGLRHLKSYALEILKKLTEEEMLQVFSNSDYSEDEPLQDSDSEWSGANDASGTS